MSTSFSPCDLISGRWVSPGTACHCQSVFYSWWYFPVDKFQDWSLSSEVFPSTYTVPTFSIYFISSNFCTVFLNLILWTCSCSTVILYSVQQILDWLMNVRTSCTIVLVCKCQRRSLIWPWDGDLLPWFRWWVFAFIILVFSLFVACGLIVTFAQMSSFLRTIFSSFIFFNVIIFISSSPRWIRSLRISKAEMFLPTLPNFISFFELSP